MPIHDWTRVSAGTFHDFHVAWIATSLIPMPHFLPPAIYVNLPLEQTCMAAYEGVPRRWKRVIEATP